MEKIEVKDEADCDIKLETKEEDDLNESKHSKNHTVLKNTRIKEEVVDLVQFEISEVSRVKQEITATEDSCGSLAFDIKCFYCDRIFPILSQLSNHIKNTHLGFPCEYTGGSIQCQLCPKIYEGVKTLAEHVQASHLDEIRKYRYECAHCGKKIKLLKRLKLHLSTHTNKRPVDCDICPKTFKNKEALYIHMKTVHTTERAFQCSDCPKAFKTKNHLKEHQMLHSGAPLSCHKCDKFFKTKSRLRVHIANAHSEKIHKCLICSKTFALSNRLKQHMNIHSEDKNTYECEICLKEGTEGMEHMIFKSKGGLRYHKDRSHNGKTFSCSICLKAFETQVGFQKHVKRHNGRLKCHICGRTFREVRTLNLHLPMHDEGKRYKCNICQREFKRAQDMRRHKESHRSEAHFNCQQCWRSFKGEYQLQVHVRNVHSGECSCPICGEVVSSKYALRCHRSLHKKSKEKIVGSSKTNTVDAGGSLTTIIVKTEYEVASFD